MEAFLVDEASGAEYAITIGEHDTAAHLRCKAHALFCYPSGVEEGDLRLATGDAVLEEGEALGGVAGVDDGCQIDVSLSGERFVAGDGESQLPLRSMPLWAQGLRECILAATRCHGLDPATASRASLCDDEVMLAALQHAHLDESGHTNPVADSRIPPSASYDPGYVDGLIKDWKRFHMLAGCPKPRSPCTVRCLCYAMSPLLLEDREFILAAASICGEVLEVAPERLRRDKAVVLAAVRTHGRALRHACFELRRDPDVALAALAEHPYQSCINPDLFASRAFMLRAVQRCPDALRCAGGGLSEDVGLVAAAMRRDPYALRYAHASLRWDKGVMEALRRQGVKLPKDLNMN